MESTDFGYLKRTRFERVLPYRELGNNVIRVLRIIKEKGPLCGCLVAEYAGLEEDVVDKIIDYLLEIKQIFVFNTIKLDEGEGEKSINFYHYKRY